LSNANLDADSFMQLSKRFDYSAMTVTRIAKELETANLVSIKGGRPKKMFFCFHGKELWEKARLLLSSPVKEKWFMDDQPVMNFMLKAGNTALSDYTDINDIGPQTFAIGKEQLQKLKEAGQLQGLNKYEGRYQLEVWNYNPKIIDKPSPDKVDRFSLYLSLEDQSADERFSAALKELINDIVW
jgi:hypothetical protein